MSTEPEATTTLLWYKGRRLTTKGTLAHAFLWPDGSTGLLSPKRDPHLIIGCEYKVETEGNSYLLGTAERTGEKHHPLAIEWRASAQNDKIRHQHERAEKKLRKNNGDIGAMTLSEARDWMGSGGVRPTRLAVLLSYLTGRSW